MKKKEKENNKNSKNKKSHLVSFIKKQKRRFLFFACFAVIVGLVIYVKIQDKQFAQREITIRNEEKQKALEKEREIKEEIGYPQYDSLHELNEKEKKGTTLEPIRVDPELMKKLKELLPNDIKNSAYTKNLNIYYVDKIDDSKWEKNGSFMFSHAGDFNGDRVLTMPTIKIKKGLPIEQEKRVLAHEFLHHVYHFPSFSYIGRHQSAKVLLWLKGMTDPVVELWQKSGFLHDQLDRYIKEANGDYARAGFVTELISYSCTELSDATIKKIMGKYYDPYGPFIINGCNEFINRNSLTFTPETQYLR